LTWSPLNPPPAGGEVQKTRWRTVPYTAGKGLDLGCGVAKLFETEFVFAIDDGSEASNANMRADARDLSQFSAGSWDYVFSSFLLQYFPYKEVPNALREWMRLIKVGGCLCLYLPDEEQYPKCNEPERSIVAESGANPRHAWNVNYARVVAAMEKLGFNWDLVEFQQCAGDDEYALWFVFRRLK
jgi:predicted SAM-dependent methyltransferase